MRQSESDAIAQELLNLQQTFETKGKDSSFVIARAAKHCVDRIRSSHPKIAHSMYELEILRAEESL